jgi:DNA-binding MarR family transcriptional regulator
VSRSDRLADLDVESRRYLAAFVLFNQAVADKLGLHPTDLQCLNLITIEDGPVTTGRIAELTGLTSGSASRLVDRLVRGGYVERRPDSQDRRRVLVSPIPAAVGRLGAVWDELSEGWAELFADYTDDELDLLLRHMRRTTRLAATQVARLRA